MMFVCMWVYEHMCVALLSCGDQGRAVQEPNQYVAVLHACIFPKCWQLWTCTALWAPPVLKLHSIVSPLRPECFAFLNDFVYSMNPYILVFNACAHFESPGFYSFTPHASDLRKNCCQFVDCYIRLHASKRNGFILGCLCQRFKTSWNALKCFQFLYKVWNLEHCCACCARAGTPALYAWRGLLMPLPLLSFGLIRTSIFNTCLVSCALRLLQ